jgi:carbonic anhydrase
MLSFLVVLISTLNFAFANAPTASVSPETSLRWLTNGNTRFSKSTLRRDGQSQTDVSRLSTAQHPHAIVLSCSDSRVPPEIVFDQKLGEVFTVRTAGEVIDDSVIGSIEYAVEHLGSRLILVMGHTQCGAVKAAHATMDGSSAGSPALNAMVKTIHPFLAQFKGKTPSANFEKESWANTEGVAHELIRKSTILGDRWKKGEIWIVPSLYDLGSGKVAFRENLPLTDTERTPSSIH